jgi:hypothetical protein
MELSYDLQKDVEASKCVQYEEITHAKGHKKMIIKKELSTIISLLTSGVPYEFKVPFFEILYIF